PAQQPVRITADRLVYNEGQGTVVFEGNVQADHAGMHLQSTKVTAHLNDQGQSKNDGDQIDRIVAEGSVVVTKDTARGTCAMLTYFVQDGVLRMEGDPVLQDGPNTVTGEIIKFYLKDNRSEILSGGGKRVEAVFTLPEEMQVR
ncbi:MAG: LptA/OstA family protein, partial [Desulfovibrionaceae bacterium]